MRALTCTRWVAAPGDGTRYEVALVPRGGGGLLLLLWDTHVARVYRGNDGWSLVPTAGRWNRSMMSAALRILSTVAVAADGSVTP